MVFVVEHMEEIPIEGMNIIKPGELINYGRELIIKILLSVLHLAHVELAEPRNCISLVHNSRCLPLGTREDDINEIFPIWHHSNLLKIILNHRTLSTFLPQKV
ncbi:hypothetical protein V8G54_023456 [Vigna mungo]|uniref:Uncharacterized protein n=1 Tax=Vigna mungo TaxID=3915 RepID=A0AAQ3N591_VIGMU